jgi:hypothetical protein
MIFAMKKWPEKSPLQKESALADCFLRLCVRKNTKTALEKFFDQIKEILPE